MSASLCECAFEMSERLCASNLERRRRGRRENRYLPLLFFFLFLSFLFFCFSSLGARDACGSKEKRKIYLVDIIIKIKT